jgi:glycyl-tRNA synthetase beta chain
MADFLFELGIEEVPVSEIIGIKRQLLEKLKRSLQDNQIKFQGIEAYSTNKRFMLYIAKIATKAEDKEEEVMGPAKRISIDDAGKPTIALQKFMESHGVTTADIIEVETPKGLYMAINKFTPGVATDSVLREVLPRVLTELSFAKSMLWNKSRVPFVRPIRNILALFNNRLVNFEFAGIKSSNKISGHGLLSDDGIEIKSYREYIERLQKNFVIVREDERKEKILQEIKDIEDEYDAQVRLDNDMLNYYVYNNEYPVVFTGEFDKKYLELPQEIISTFMINEKKLNPVFSKENEILNVFVGVSNIPDENRFVADGNERVIQATFEDAKFFWDNDLKDDFVALREDLKNVMFQRDLGTFYDKTERMSFLIDVIVNNTGHKHLSEKIKKACLLCKNDLLTRMVREFPSLQGIMGGLYLKNTDADSLVWESIYGHYEPKGYTDKKLEHLGAGILSIADKMDNLAAFISRGTKISSSKDPLGIRRDCNAIVKIILEFKLDFDLGELISAAAGMFADDSGKKKELEKKIQDLFLGRMENILKDIFKIRYDFVNAIIKKNHTRVYRTFLRGTDMQTMENSEAIQDLVMIHKRLRNMIKNSPAYDFSKDLLAVEAEKLLNEIFEGSKGKIEALIEERSYVQACSEILEMKPVIEKFFEDVLVMDKDEKIKQNRIALLQKIDGLLSGIADFSLIQE